MFTPTRSTICRDRSTRRVHALKSSARDSAPFKRFVDFAALFLIAATAARAQGPVLVVQPSAIVQTVAGTGTEGLSGDSGPATSAKIASPTAIVTDAAGNLYFADRDNHCIRKIDRAGKITTVAGSGLEGFAGDGGPATSALLDTPGGVALDAAGNLFIADTRNDRIRVVTNGVITTYAGTGVAGFCGDGGPPAAACLLLPMGVAFDSSGGLYIADSGNNRVRLISGGIISTIAGTAFQGNAGDGGPAVTATLDVPTGVMVDSTGTLYIADASNERIRTVSGGIISAFAGTGTEGYSGDGGPAASAKMALPMSVREDTFGRFLIADTNNQVIRQIASGTITSVAGIDLEGPALGNAPDAAVFDTPTDTVPVITGFYVTDTNNQRIRRVDYSALDFGNIPVGSKSAAKPITLSNSGTANVIVSTLQLTGSAFQIVSGGSCPATLPFTITPSTSCIVNVVFTPSTTTTFAEKAILTDNSPGSPQTVIATGVGVLNPTTLALTAQPSAPTYGDAVAFEAKISDSAAASVPLPTGQIAFENEGAQLGKKVVAQKAAEIDQALLTAGAHVISAGYGGDALYSSSAANLSLSVAKATPAITLVTNPAPVEDGGPAVLTASVQFQASVPTGSVEFFDGTTSLGTAPLNSAGVATLNISALGSGTHALHARYRGDSNFNAVSSANSGTGEGSFTLKASTGSVSGTSETITLTITPVNGFNQNVALSCSSLPANASCGFSPSTVTLNGTSPATASMTITTQASCSSTGGSASFSGAILLPCVFFFGLFSRRKRLRALLFAACVFLVGSGCAGQKVTCFAAAGNYTLAVTGTSNVGSTAVTQTTTVTFTVGSNGVISSSAD
jgi:Bacterial Ig-like domain (group 3)/NHL repeat